MCGPRSIHLSIIMTAAQEPTLSHDRGWEQHWPAADVDASPVKRSSEKVTAGGRTATPRPSSEGGRIAGTAASLAPCISMLSDHRSAVTGVWRTEGFPYALDNGAWTDFSHNRDFDDEKFKPLVDRLGGQADWIVAPDIVAGGLRSLRLSLVWLAPLLVRTRMVLVPVQD